MDKAEKALDFHKRGYACSQAVFAVFADDFGLELEFAKRIASGFGGGVGRTGQICGALSGAIMALGLKYGMKEESKPEDKINTYEKVQEFLDQFRAIHSATACNDLLGLDITNAEDRKLIKEKGLSASVCRPAIQDAVKIVESMIA